jgi:hypothetical protein
MHVTRFTRIVASRLTDWNPDNSGCVACSSVVNNRSLSHYVDGQLAVRSIFNESVEVAQFHALLKLEIGRY